MQNTSIGTKRQLPYSMSHKSQIALNSFWEQYHFYSEFANDYLWSERCNIRTSRCGNIEGHNQLWSCEINLEVPISGECQCENNVGDLVAKKDGNLDLSTVYICTEDQNGLMRQHLHWRKNTKLFWWKISCEESNCSLKALEMWAKRSPFEDCWVRWQAD